MIKLASDQVFLNGRMVAAVVAVEDGSIRSVTPGKDWEEGCVDLRGYRLSPGLIDTHIHGCAGMDTMDATYEALEKMSAYLASRGVTSFLPTTVTAPEAKILKAVSRVADAMEKGVPGARILGSYIEGPFITAGHKGAHPADQIRPLSAELDRILEAGRGTVRTMLVAPELDHAREAIHKLRGKGVRVSLGHTSATCEQAASAMASGAQIVAHIYNGMPSLHHRTPGVLGAALTTPDVYTEMICDGFHVAPRAMEIVARCKDPGRVLLITDCMRAGGMPDGEYTLGELRVRVTGGAAHLIDNDSLAGSTLSLNKAVCNYSRLARAPFEAALRAACENPARVHGLSGGIGKIAPGMQADLAALDGECNAVMTLVGGKVVWDQR